MAMSALRAGKIGSSPAAAMAAFCCELNNATIFLENLVALALFFLRDVVEGALCDVDIAHITSTGSVGLGVTTDLLWRLV